MKVVMLTPLLLLIPTLVFAQINQAVSSAPEPTDVYIRRLAGLPAKSARGEVRIIDVGHSPLSTMLSIVANRGSKGWHVSYACAASSHCTQGADHLALSYDVGNASTRQVDLLLAELKTAGDPGGTKPSPGLICGNITVVIDYQNFQRDYSRSCSSGPTLSELEALLKPPSSGV